jgi:CrcB protein
MKIIELAFLAFGGVLGTFLRYKIISIPVYVGALQANVLLVNIIGSFILGAFAVFSQQWHLDGKYALLVAFGFCGSLTTMSAVAFDTHSFLSSAKYGLMALNAILNLGCSVAAIFGARALFNVIFGNNPI